MLMKFYSLKSLREACGLRQGQVAERLGYCKNYYCWIETGRYKSEKITQQAWFLLYETAKKMELDYNSLRIMRLRADLTQGQAAERLGISGNWYNDIERGICKAPALEGRARAVFQRAIEDLERTDSDD